MRVYIYMIYMIYIYISYIYIYMIYIYTHTHKRTDASFGISSAGGSMLRLEGLLEPSGGEARCRGASASCACRTQTGS